MLACKEGHSGVVKLLLEKGAQADLQDNRGRSALMYSSERNKLEVAKLLLENGAQVRHSGLWRVVCFDDCQFNGISKLLLDYGAQVDLQQKGGGSALMMASQGGHFEVAQLLLNNEAQVDMQDDTLLPVILGMIK